MRRMLSRQTRWSVWRDPSPILHIWSKISTPLPEVAPAPGETATLNLGTVQSTDTDPNQYWSDTGAISIVDSRNVEIYGLTIENYSYDGPAQTPAGIYITTRSDTQNTNQNTVPHLSACFLNGGSCSDIYIIDNTVHDITNAADENYTTKSDCNNSNVDAYGIAVIAAGSATSQKLQHVVVDGDRNPNTAERNGHIQRSARGLSCGRERDRRCGQHRYRYDRLGDRKRPPSREWEGTTDTTPCSKWITSRTTVR